MPTVTETTIEALASCRDARCPGYKQQPVQAVLATTSFSYVDSGGDVPGIEREVQHLRFVEEEDIPCEYCGEPRLVADQTRPVYPNVSGQPQDKLLHVNRDGERVQDLVLAGAQRDAEMAQMRALIERQTAALERQELQIERMQDEREPKARPRKGATE